MNQEENNRRQAELRRSVNYHESLRPVVTAERLRSLRDAKVPWKELEERFRRNRRFLKKVLEAG